MDYLTNLQKNLKRVPNDRLDAMLEKLQKDYYDCKDQFDNFCDLCKEGFEHLPELEREEADASANKNRLDWYLRTELAWSTFQTFDDMRTNLKK